MKHRKSLPKTLVGYGRKKVDKSRKSPPVRPNMAKQPDMLGLSPRTVPLIGRREGRGFVEGTRRHQGINANPKH